MSFSKAIDLLRLARIAGGHVGVNLDQIEAEFGCVRRSAQRMTQALEQVFPDTDDYVGNDGRKYWRVPLGRISEFFRPTADEVAALELASKSLDQQGLITEAEQLRSLRETVKILTSDRRRRGLEADEDALLEAMGHAARPGPGPQGRPDVDAAIAQALKGPFELEINYRSRQDTAPTVRVVEPYGLLLGPRRYLVARDPRRSDNQMRHYRVEDIERAVPGERWFARDPDFDFDAYSRRSFGIYQSDSEYKEVVWKFTPQAADHAARFKFHPDQVTERNSEGALIVRFTASGYLEMCWHLYAWGDQVEVLAPKELADLVTGYRRSDFPGLP
jgi:predicted DNA-binding transcriptional regulator YafY